jgi:23S rRNA (uracil1939-C5)-methyltransferase
MAKRRRAPKKRGQSRQSAIRGRTVELEISGMAQGGRGLAKLDGKTVFVPYTLPGESVTVEITRRRGSALFARGLRLRAASADRVPPRCSHFGPGRCWECQWQHIAYPAQLLLKQDVLADQLSRQGKLPDALIEAVLRPALPAPETWAYNHTLRLSRDRQGNWGLRRDGGGFQAIDECLITHPDLLELLRQLDLDYTPARRMILRRGGDGRLMLIFEVSAEEAPDLRADLPLSVNLILPDREPINLIGDAFSHYSIAGHNFRVTAGSSIRSNIAGVELLVNQVMRALQLQGGERALDLYAGVGVFSAFLARRAALATLVESYPPAVSDADVNLQGMDNVDVVEGQVEAVLADMEREGARYEVAVVDPPSSGLGQEVIERLSRLGIERLVYVSGDPASLARDSRQLIDAGFLLRAVQPIDLAPQTYYISALAIFER